MQSKEWNEEKELIEQNYNNIIADLQTEHQTKEKERLQQHTTQLIEHQEKHEQQLKELIVKHEITLSLSTDSYQKELEKKTLEIHATLHSKHQQHMLWVVTIIYKFSVAPPNTISARSGSPCPNSE